MIRKWRQKHTALRQSAFHADAKCFCRSNVVFKPLFTNQILFFCCFFLLLMLLFRSVCHQVSNQADNLILLAIFIVSRLFAHLFKWASSGKCFLTTYNMQLTNNKKQWAAWRITTKTHKLTATGANLSVWFETWWQMLRNDNMSSKKCQFRQNKANKTDISDTRGVSTMRCRWCCFQTLANIQFNEYKTSVCLSTLQICSQESLWRGEADIFDRVTKTFPTRTHVNNDSLRVRFKHVHNQNLRTGDGLGKVDPTPGCLYSTPVIYVYSRSGL